MQPKSTNSRIITPECVLSFPHLIEPRPGLEPGSEPKFSCVLVFDPLTNIGALYEIARQVGVENWGPKFDEMKRAGRIKWPFRTDDKHTYGDGQHIYLNVNSKQKPELVDRYAEP